MEGRATALILVLCTCPDRDTAERIAIALVERRLAACVNVLPGVRSFYIWQANTEVGDELLLLIKSSAFAYPDLQAAIKDMHPYEVPEIVALSIERGLPTYLNWVKEVMEDKP
jgi:periplasmic divalent cation tolerance protein